MRSIGGRRAEGFQNDQVVIHVVRNSRAASVVTDMLAGRRPSIWVSDLYGAQQGHADLWQVCLAHQLRDCAFAIKAGYTVFAPHMKSLLLRAIVLARRCKTLAESTRRAYLCQLDHELAPAGDAPPIGIYHRWLPSSDPRTVPHRHPANSSLNRREPAVLL